MSLPGPSVLKGKALPLGGITAKQNAAARSNVQLEKYKSRKHDKKILEAGKVVPPPAPSTLADTLPLPPAPDQSPPSATRGEALNTNTGNEPGQGAPRAPSASAGVSVPVPPRLPTAAQNKIELQSDLHERANSEFASGNYHKAAGLYKQAISAVDGDKHTLATLQSNLAATFVRLHRYQEATVAARAAVNTFGATPDISTAKAFYRLMQGLGGQRLLPEAVGVGMRAIQIVDSAISESEKGTTNVNDKGEVAAQSGDVKTSSAQLMACRRQLVKLLERIHTQTVGKPKTAGDSLLVPSIDVSSTAADGQGSDPFDDTKGRSRLIARSEELSRRILGLGVYSNSGVPTDSSDGNQVEKENNAGIASAESRVNVVDMRYMEESAMKAHPEAFAPVLLGSIRKQLRGFKLRLLSDDADANTRHPHGIFCTTDVSKGEVLYCDLSPVVAQDWGASVASLSASDALDRGACDVLQKLWNRSIIGFGIVVRRLFTFYAPSSDVACKLANPFAPENRAVLRNFSQELACQSFGSDNIACLKNYAGNLTEAASGNPLAAILLCLHCIRRALQPFRKLSSVNSDGGAQQDAGVALSLGCPVRHSGTAVDATVSFEVDCCQDDPCVRIIAARDMHEGSELKAFFVGRVALSDV